VLPAQLGTQLNGVADPVGVAECKLRVAGLEPGALPLGVVEEVGAPGEDVVRRVLIVEYVRDFLFQARLTLYVTRPDWAAAFREPAFCVILGRSQDLACVTAVDELELEERQAAYLEHTILPFSYRPFVPIGSTVLMPRYIEPPPERHARFERFIVLRERIFAGRFEGATAVPQRFRMLGDAEPSWWVDPQTLSVRGQQRAIVLHKCV
jgi:CRISPR-associated protein Cas5t